MSDGYKKSEITKQKILSAAIELFEERGHEATSVRDICEKSGVSLSRMNYHFGSKDNLILQISIILPTKIHGEIERRHPDYNRPRTIAGDLSFTMLLIKILLSDGNYMNIYRKIYSDNVVADHIAESSRNTFIQWFSSLKLNKTKEMIQVLANAYAHCIVSLVKENTFDIAQKNVDAIIDAVSEFYMMILQVPKEKHQQSFDTAKNLIQDIHFKVKGITQIEFY